MIVAWYVIILHPIEHCHETSKNMCFESRSEPEKNSSHDWTSINWLLHHELAKESRRPDQRTVFRNDFAHPQLMPWILWLLTGDNTDKSMLTRLIRMKCTFAWEELEPSLQHAEDLTVDPVDEDAYFLVAFCSEIVGMMGWFCQLRCVSWKVQMYNFLVPPARIYSSRMPRQKRWRQKPWSSHNKWNRARRRCKFCKKKYRTETIPQKTHGSGGKKRILCKA